MSSDDDDDDDEEGGHNPATGFFGAGILTSTVTKKSDPQLTSIWAPKIQPVVTEAMIMKEPIALASATAHSLFPSATESNHAKQTAKSPLKRPHSVDEPVKATINLTAKERFTDPSPVKRSRMEELIEAPVVPEDAIKSETAKKSLDVTRVNDNVGDPSLPTGLAVASTTGREAKPEIRNLKARLGRLNKKLRIGGSGDSKSSEGSGPVLSESMFSENAEESRQKSSSEPVATDNLRQGQPEESSIPSSQERTTTRSFNASLAKISSKLVKTSKGSVSNSVTVPVDSTLDNSIPDKVQPLSTKSSILHQALSPKKSISSVSTIDSDGDIDMSIEDYHNAEEIEFDSIDPAKELCHAAILVKNTQKIDDVITVEDEEMEESGPNPSKSNKERTALQKKGSDLELIPKTPTLAAHSKQDGTGEQGWGAGIMRIGEKLVSNLTAFLPSPSKAVATPGSTTSSHIPKPISRVDVPSHTHTQPPTAPAASRLALKKDPGIRAKELAKKRQLDEEKRAIAAKEQEEAIRLNLAEKQRIELMEAASRIPPVKSKPVVVEKKVDVDISVDEDMELCSQPQQQTGVVRVKSKIPSAPTKLPIASSSHPNSNPASAITDFAVPMAATKNLKEPTSETATPKALPRHNPSAKPHLQSILKPATPSFDVKLAERVKEGLVQPEPAIVIAPKSKYGSGNVIGNEILGGLFDAAAPKKKTLSSSSSSSSLLGKKNSGPATIVDENGDLPDIKDSDEEDEISDDDDDARRHPNGGTAAIQIPEPKKAVVPAWVETPNLMKTLAQQVVRDPDEIFGSVRPLVLEDVFKGGRVQRKFRDSMAGNWVGNGELTPEEEEEYKQLMGFK
ncbi:hypothetical protein BDR26DRAFT_863386 [Obelidium mucronatum]|nr:hypothetical protein BDR26DRAFT_863386 [Obelidium mucronatum]